ncbi:Protein SUPPRESSOR OF K(+) TRANSPORT GROWTH DEFECT 1 [Frankliniella fusca]|uniref:Protein SUPPRESSOR OF K(+) TRANSPORT GROWTH DEFECT 1 n=1 Tax=Frankliniella fusca TaxID=407009 RepID=A0AAE1HYP7_9NEOP|nr:Protein SUPPRESSOR OF K(+) TRANSPORT GROWTH DEFECT 1 [Frankliniella fusca]
MASVDCSRALLERRAVSPPPPLLPFAPAQPAPPSTPVPGPVGSMAPVPTVSAGTADSSSSDGDPGSIGSLRRHVGADMGLSSLAGMAHAKRLLTEAVVLPLKFPHLFQGEYEGGHSSSLRPWQSVLLFGPPGTGKTRLALAVAAEVSAELYCISPADLLSSWFGQTEQNIRELFGQVRERARSRRVIVFLDEVDGLCRRRTHEEPESTRRMKTELLTQLQQAPRAARPGPAGRGQAAEAAEAADTAQLFYVCATNCPWEIDPAFLRRFEKRIFIGLPDRECRQEIIRSGVNFHVDPASLQDPEWQALLDRTEGFSGSDITDLVKNALYQPIRELTSTTHWIPAGSGLWMPCSSNRIGALRQNMDLFPPHTVIARPVTVRDFLDVLEMARPTVCPEDLARYELFTRQFGQLG